MKTKESTTEYSIPPTRGEWNMMFALLPKVAAVFGVQDRTTMDRRMKGWLIGQGWIKESRKELDRFQVDEIIRRYEAVLANPEKYA